MSKSSTAARRLPNREAALEALYSDISAKSMFPFWATSVARLRLHRSAVVDRIEHHNSYLKGTSISVASCSFDNGVAMYLKLTASAIARSRPSMRSGKTLFFG